DTLEQNQILDVIHGGANRGTWAHELIALKYAAWLSASFEVKVALFATDSILSRLRCFVFFGQARNDQLNLFLHVNTFRFNT
ncbi:KilA-N domain-containing protein, partial [Citrobacter portucalensis]|uniref:KilA-N domain-containing protein n=1 Tax=Citrobacter portucalensis TaxID=1639133 RepID=UPI003EE1BD8E